MERAQFDRLLMAAVPRIELTARKIANTYGIAHEWQDIAQSAFLKMLRFADQYDPEKGELLPWACVILINTIKSHLAYNRKYLSLGEITPYIIDHIAATSPTPEHILQASFILDNLNRETRLYFEGYNYYEIAAKCGVKSQVTAMYRIDKCVKRLSLVLGRDYTRIRRQRMVAKKPG